MKLTKQIILISAITINLYFFVDYFFGNKLLDFFNLNKDESFRISNEYYNHGFKENYATENAYWGPHKYKFCSNNFGLRSDCNNEYKLKYDTAFIGDSQTEGVGLDFNETFAGIYSTQKDVNILNFGIIQSSPTIYLKRLNFFLEKNIKFNELFILLDLSDLHDEIKYNKDLFKNDIDNKCSKLKNNILSNDYKVSNYKNTYKNFLKNNLKITYLISNLIWWNLNFKKYFGSYSFDYLEKNFYRTAWTYNDNISHYGGAKCMEYMIVSLKNKVDQIYKLLKINNIDLSIIVAPWPGSLIHDNVNSRHVKLWRKFCESRCKKFVNLYPYFFDYAEKNGKINTINKFFFKYDVHYNNLANKIIADHLIKNY